MAIGQRNHGDAGPVCVAADDVAVQVHRVAARRRRQEQLRPVRRDVHPIIRSGPQHRRHHDGDSPARAWRRDAADDDGGHVWGDGTREPIQLETTRKGTDEWCHGAG